MTGCVVDYVQLGEKKSTRSTAVVIVATYGRDAHPERWTIAPSPVIALIPGPTSLVMAHKLTPNSNPNSVLGNPTLTPNINPNH